MVIHKDAYHAEHNREDYDKYVKHYKALYGPPEIRVFQTFTVARFVTDDSSEIYPRNTVEVYS